MEPFIRNKTHLNKISAPKRAKSDTFIPAMVGPRPADTKKRALKELMQKLTKRSLLASPTTRQTQKLTTITAVTYFQNKDAGPRHGYGKL